MVFKETTIFTKQINRLISDDEYKELQNFLLKTPSAGDIISGGGGIRKLRWKLGGQGKRGGLRLIYFWYVPKDEFIMLLAYSKNEQDNLTDEQVKKLKQIVEKEIKSSN
jgi:hypothetical protein